MSEMLLKKEYSKLFSCGIFQFSIIQALSTSTVTASPAMLPGQENRVGLKTDKHTVAALIDDLPKKKSPHLHHMQGCHLQAGVLLSSCVLELEESQLNMILFFSK